MWSVFSKGKHPSALRIAFAVAAAFCVTGAAWVLITDVLLYEMTRDQVLVARIETAKGWTFIMLATMLVFLVTYRATLRLARAQAGITAVVDSIGDGVLLLGPDRRIRRANPAAARILGADDLVGMDAKEFSRRFRLSYLDGSIVPPNEFISQRLFEEGGPLHYTAVVHPERGPEVVIGAIATAVRVYADEAPEMVVSVFHDVTELEKLHRLRDEFFGAAAHALKTPVAVVKANVQVLLEDDGAHAKEAALAIGRQCDRMDLLVQNLFVVARIRSNTLELYPHEVEIAPLVERVTAAIAAVAADGRVHSELRASANPRVHADQERIGLALRNLLDEALRCSAPTDPVTVLLEEQGRDVEIGVRHHPRSPAARTELAIHEAELRLARLVTRTIVAAHGGALRQDEQGAEATAWLRLPAIVSA